MKREHGRLLGQIQHRRGRSFTFNLIRFCHTAFSTYTCMIFNPFIALGKATLHLYSSRFPWVVLCCQVNATIPLYPRKEDNNRCGEWTRSPSITFTAFYTFRRLLHSCLMKNFSLILLNRMLKKSCSRNWEEAGSWPGFPWIQLYLCPCVEVLYSGGTVSGGFILGDTVCGIFFEGAQCVAILFSGCTVCGRIIFSGHSVFFSGVTASDSIKFRGHSEW